jgi:hypothetical protein
VEHIAASRTGNTVEVKFRVPISSTDKLPLRTPTISGSLCRQVEHGTCTPVASLPARIDVPAKDPDGQPTLVTWTDTLPADLTAGPARQIAYRVEFYNAAGRSAGPSEAAYSVAGAAPPVVEGLRAEGSRDGIILRWKPEPASAGDVLLRREDLQPGLSAKLPAGRKKSQTLGAETTPGVVWLVAAAPDRALDDSALPDVPYRYTAVRRESAQVGGRTLELRSAASAPAVHVLREIYPPLAPTNLTAAGFTTAASGAQAAHFAVDLIWQPVNDARLAGYNVYRQTLDAAGKPLGERTKLNDAVVTLPAFNDATASATARYRYSVTAVDAKNIDAMSNESPAATMVLEPSATQ